MNEPDRGSWLPEAFVALSEGRLSRRQFVQRALVAGLSSGAIAAFLAACGGSATTPTTASGGATATRPATVAATAAATTAPRTATAATRVASPAATARPGAAASPAAGGAPQPMGTLPSGYPRQPITVVVPFDPGGGTDVMMRALAAGVEQERLIPVPLVIENRSGGNGVVGRQYAIGRPPDGYTLVNVSEDNAASQLLGQGRWDYRTDFTYISRLVSDYNMIVVKADSPYRTVQDLVAVARRERVNMGGTSIGGADHVHMIQFGQAAGLPRDNLTFVSFRSGGEVMNNVLGGQVGAAWANPSEAVGQLEGKTARALAVTAPQRLGGQLADIPTFKEQGIDLVVQQWRGVGGPKGMSAEIVQYLETFFQRAAQTKAWNDYVQRGQLINAYLNGRETLALLDEEYKTLDKIFTDLGLKR